MMKTNTCSVLFATLLALAIPSHVEAHGYVKSLQIVGGESFTGPKPGSTGPNKSPIRGITDQSPLTDLQAKDIICGRGASAGSLVASAKPGDMLSISWANALSDNGNWIHDTGPMMTYFTQVPAGQTADKFNPEGAKWFKTDQIGKKDNVWVQASLMTGASVNTKIPETLADGDYLVRHEIIALHNAKGKGGAEFYPACLQVRIKNSNAGNATVTATPTVSFPGAYSPTDPGILVNVFEQPLDGSKYEFPAGPVAAVSAPGATGNSPNVTVQASSSAPTSTASSATSTPISTVSTISPTSAVPTVSPTSTVSTVSLTSTVSTASRIVTTTASSPTANTTASSTPVPTTSPDLPDLQGIRLENGRAAQELNLAFKSVAVSDKCQPNTSGCVDGEFSMCTPQGTWSLQGACFTGASCFAFPLRNIKGIQIGCFPEAFVKQAIENSGAAITSSANTTPAPTTTSVASTSPSRRALRWRRHGKY
ncbi:endo-beta-1,4-glucanase D [Ceratobasidium theobromae]|uniref:lytic cellulose monooxygenase (C4-dehydrogenating) n=1 Tax=Ceratobasidium theobromae TaxID=1582974 RepID=A0A5N5QMV1_9AGAM|nr:endo-beta-1,4-glucanase D [Ceratobasidium theobromae]